MKQSKFPPDWDELRMKKALEHYETQSEEEAVAEDEEGAPGQTVMKIPVELVPLVREIIAKRKAA